MEMDGGCGAAEGLGSRFDIHLKWMRSQASHNVVAGDGRSERAKWERKMQI